LLTRHDNIEKETSIIYIINNYAPWRHLVQMRNCNCIGIFINYYN